MIIRWIVCVLVGLVGVLPLAAETPETGSETVHSIGIEKFGNTPLVFEPNYGQTDSSVRFLSRGDRYGLFLTDTEAIVSLTGSTPAMVRMQLVGQNPHPKISGAERQPGASHYFKGSESSKWLESVPQFLKVAYQEVYPGIDLTYYGNQRQLEYDFTLRPHANPKSIELKFSGADDIEIDGEGDLILHTAAGDIRHQHPRVYQKRNGLEETVEGQFVLLGSGKVGFQLGNYDSALPLVIDPKFVYATYFGGSGPNGDIGIDIKVDSQGTTYVTGYTSSMDFFTSNLSPTAPGGGNLDAFVMKVNSSGTSILSAVYFGGSSDDEGHRIALDNAGFVYVTGYTTSTDFPIVNGFQTKLGGRKDAYIAKIDNAVSQILFSSYIGGALDESPFGLSVDVAGNIYIAGETLSSNFPTVRAIRSRRDGQGADAFVTKISPDGGVIYSTYLGGIGNDHAYDVTSDADGNAYVVGYTTSFDFPLVHGYVLGYRGGSEDAFITKLSPDGSTYLFSSFIGGSLADEAIRVALDPDQNIIVAGYTRSIDYPIKNAFQPNNAGEFDIFLTKFLPDLSDAIFSTYIGSDGTESPPGLAVDSAGNIFLAGFTSSFSFPVVNGINIGTSGGNLHGDRDAYVMKLDPAGQILFSTYVGGSSSDGAIGISVDAAGNAYVTGYTFSLDFPVVNAFQTMAAGASDGILMKINAEDVVIATPLIVPAQGGKTIATVGGSNAVRFAHATFSVPDGSKRTAGMAILDLRQAGGEVGEVAFPLLPFITDGRVYVNEGPVQATNVSIVNPSGDAVMMYFFMTDRSGVRSRDGGISIPANSAFAQPVTGPPFFLPSNASGTLTFSTTAPVAAMAFRTINESNSSILLTYLPIVDPYKFETRPTTIPQYITDLKWGSEFLLVNNTETPMTGVVRFYNNGTGNGDPTMASVPIELTTDRGAFTDLPYNLAPLASDNFSTSGVETTISGYAQIIPDAGTFTPVGNVILTYAGSGPATLHATVEAQIPANDFRLYAEFSGDFDKNVPTSTTMSFAASNPSETPTNITLTLVGIDGTPTGLSTTITLPERGHISTYLHNLAAFSSMPNPFQGILLVHASGPGIVLFGMRVRISESGNIVGTATGPIKENPGGVNSVIFPHVLDGGGYATQFILFSDPSGAGTTGTLSFADENGTGLPLAIQPATLPGLPKPSLPPASALANSVQDLDGDGKADIIWRDTDGTVYAGLMNGSTLTNEKSLGAIWTGWTIVGSGDFNGDGKSDILWHDENGNVAIWLMDGLAMTNYVELGNVDTAWSIVGVGDFNGDGKPDILWRDTSGNVAIWLMDGTTMSSFGTVGNVWTGWSVAGVGDTNGDGKADILWRDTSGNVAIWFMNGTSVASFANIGNMPLDTSIAGFADYNGDGKADILWHDTAGNVSMWLMNGGTVVSKSLIGNIWTGWSVVGNGDFDGDGKADILWRGDFGNEVMWFMNGSSVSSFHLVSD